MPPNLPVSSPQMPSGSNPESKTSNVSIPYRVARTALVLYVLTFLLNFVTFDAYLFYFAVMAIWALVGLIFGSRKQRILSAILLATALALFLYERNRLDSIAEERATEKAHRLHQLRKENPIAD